jgi:sugar phosphate isomerase/epimerase
MGLVSYCVSLRRSFFSRSISQKTSPNSENPAYLASTDLSQPESFLAHAHALQCGGIQVGLGIMDGTRASAIREEASKLGMFIEAIVKLPSDKFDRERFEGEVKSAVAAGALAARTTMLPGRRYEFFESMEHYRQFDQKGRQSVELAAPIVEKHRLPLAIENHKDHRATERVALFTAISSEYVGACVDTGNSFALLEDPDQTVEALAPWAMSVHLKDQAIAPHEQGFLLGDIPLGKGFLDLPRMVKTLREAKPKIRFCLELITRDPLIVPVLESKYWRTFPDLPASDLARTMRNVREHGRETLPQVTGLTPQQGVELEDRNIRESLDYSRTVLQL